MSKSDSRKRSLALAVRVTREEADAIREKARDAGATVSQFLRACALGRTTRNTVDSQIINELRRLGALQKYLFDEGNGAGTVEYAAILLEVKKAVARIAT